jgi:hypothetical protein
MNLKDTKKVFTELNDRLMELKNINFTLSKLSKNSLKKSMKNLISDDFNTHQAKIEDIVDFFKKNIS